MYAITTTSRTNRQVYEPEFNDDERLAMPRLGERKNDDGIPTYLRLPRATRDKLEAVIGHNDIKTLTDAVVAAAEALEKTIKKNRPPKAPSDSKSP